MLSIALFSQTSFSYLHIPLFTDTFCGSNIQSTVLCYSDIIIIIIIIIGIQSGDWYGSGTLHPGQVLRVSLPLISPAF